MADEFIEKELQRIASSLESIFESVKVIISAVLDEQHEGRCSSDQCHSKDLGIVIPVAISSAQIEDIVCKKTESSD